MNGLNHKGALTPSLGDFELALSYREVFEEKPGEPGCYQKLVFWEARACPTASVYSAATWWSLTERGPTRVAAARAVLEKLFSQVSDD